MPAKSEFACDACGRRFAWKPALAGKKAKCKCGERLVVPETDPAAVEEASFAGFELDLPDDSAAPGVAPAASASAEPGKCVACNHPLKPDAVICLNCGTDQRTGSKIQTGVEELDGKTRRKANIKAKLPLWIMRVLQVGMWCNLGGVLLVILGAIGLAVAEGMAASNPTSPPPASQVVLLIAVVVELLGLALVLLGPLLCIAVPSESDARGVLIVAIVLSGVAMGIDVFAEFSQVPWWATLISTVLSPAGTLCFLFFLLMLSKYLSFDSVYEIAEKTIRIYFGIMLCTIALFIPIIGCFLILVLLGLYIYGFVLYVYLLVAMNAALSTRIGQMR